MRNPPYYHELYKEYKILQAKNKQLKDLLSELYDEVSYEWAGE